MEVLADLVCGEGLLLGLEVVIFSLCSHIAKEERKLLRVSSYKRTNPIHEGFTLLT